MDLEPAEGSSTQLVWYFACGAFLEFIAFLVSLAVMLAIRDAQANALDTGVLTFCLLLLLPFHVCGIGLLLYPLHRWRGAQSFREMLAQTDRTAIHPGDPLHVTVHLQPIEPMPVESISASVRCTEAGRLVSEHETRLSPATVLEATRRLTFEFATRIPEGSSPSSDRVSWTLCLRIPTARDPQQKREFQLPVAPFIPPSP